MSVCSDSHVTRFIVDSITLSQTLVGRDKSTRFWQYCARMLSGLTGWEIFAKLMSTLSVTRKTFRFYKPVKVAKAIVDVRRDTDLDEVERFLTTAEMGNDGLNALVDHLCFLQRIGGLKWMTPRQVDNLDRFAEVFWFGEVVSVICREMRAFFKLEMQAESARKARHLKARSALKKEDKGEEEKGGLPRRPSSLALIHPLISYPSSTAFRDEAPGERKAVVKDVRRKQSLNRFLLFKAIFLDLPCALYMMQPAAFRNQRQNKAWCGFLGMCASAMSLLLNWPAQN